MFAGDEVEDAIDTSSADRGSETLGRFELSAKVLPFRDF